MCTGSSRHPRTAVLSESSNDRQYHTLNLTFGQLEVTSETCSKHRGSVTTFNMVKPEPSLEDLQNEWKQLTQKTLPSAALSKSDAQVRSWIPSDYLDDQLINVPCSQNGQYTWIISHALFWTMLLGLTVIGRGRLRVLLIEICQGNSVSRWIFLNSYVLWFWNISYAFHVRSGHKKRVPYMFSCTPRYSRIRHTNSSIIQYNPASP